MVRRALFGVALGALSLALSNPAHAVTSANIAKAGTASQSSTDFGGTANLAIDGGTYGNYGDGSVTHTGDFANSSWEVDLGVTTTIDSINLFNRADCCGPRLGNFRVSVLDAGNFEVYGENFGGSVAQAGSKLFTLPGGVVGQKVRVQLNGLNNEGQGTLSLAEVQVMGQTSVANNTNLARAFGSANQSTTDFGGTAVRAIDGNTDGNYGAGSTTHTLNAANSFWEVDLSNTFNLESIRLFNRTDCCGNRLGNFRLSVLDAGQNEVFGQDIASVGGNINVALPFGLKGESVRVQLLGNNPEGNGVLSLAEVQVMGGELPNLARNPNAVASQSTTGFGGDAARAIDGNTDGLYGNNSVSHTAGDQNAFWEVALGDSFSIDEVILFNRTDCCGDRLGNFRVSLFDGANEVFGQDFIGSVGSQLAIDLQGEVGDRVRVQLMGDGGIPGEPFLALAEVQVFGSAIPEPASAALGLMGMLMLGLRSRRNRVA